MRAKFVHAASTEPCEIFGVVFPKDEWVDVSALAADEKERLASNPTFETKEPDAPAKGSKAT